MEHVTGGKNRLSLVIIFPVSTQQITVTSDNLFRLRIPHDELFVASLARIKLVDIDFLASSSASLAESNLSQSPDLLHHVGCIVCGNDIDFIVALVGHAKALVGRQFAFEHFLVNGLNNWLFHLLICLLAISCSSVGL